MLVQRTFSTRFDFFRRRDILAGHRRDSERDTLGNLVDDIVDLDAGAEDCRSIDADRN